MNYQQVLDWLFVQLPMYQNLGAKAFKSDLSNTILLSNYLNNPESKFKSIHVGGTNGKGSTSHMLASILQEAGYKVGLYTSPHLKDFRERIKINGTPIAEDKVVSFVMKNKAFFEQNSLSFFEMTVGMAFQYFSESKVDIAIVEVGLGGRLDSTNIIHPELSVITNIGLDHTQFLGDTLVKIAYEKAGIIKQGVPIVIGEYQESVVSVFSEKASVMKAPIFFAERENLKFYESDLKGIYQAKNIKTVTQAIKLISEKGFNVLEENIEQGFLNVVANTGLLGRWQPLGDKPKIICDTAHNKEGLIYTMQQLVNEKAKNLRIVFGVVADKDLNSILALFPKEATYYFCSPKNARGLDAELLKEKASEFGLYGNSYTSVSDAYLKAVNDSKSKDLIYIGGSTFVVAEVL